MGVNLQPPDYTPTNWKGFFIKAIFPKPEVFAWLIKMVESGKITRYTARKLIEDHCEHRKQLVMQILENEEVS
jgi:Asp-tRNA(Asn)/Glu-tRNA(Gln) amidotransferase B subunit